MRCTAEIICAVKERKQVTPEELRLALLVMNSTEYFLRRICERAIESIENKKAIVMEMAAADAKTMLRTRLFEMHKADPEKWLGPDNIPGNPQHDARYDAGIKMIDKMLTRPFVDPLAEMTTERDLLLRVLTAIGQLVGCNHINDAEGQEKLVKCVRESLRNARAAR